MSAGQPDTRIDVVIVAYRSRELLERCLRSVIAHAPPGTEVTVVDNASNDGTVEMIGREFPGVRLLENRANEGFGAATNAGARGGSGEFILILNPDTEIDAETLPKLLEAMRSHPEAGCAGPALFQPDGTFDHAARRGFPTPVSALGHFSGLGRRVGGGLLAAYRAPEVESGPVDAVNGAFMLLRREAFDSLGGFDEGYWMYMEDLDLSWRLAQAGWITWYEPSARATHIKAGTTGGRRTPLLEIHFHRGMGRFYRRHYAPGHSGAFNALIYAGIGVKLGATLAGGVVQRLLSRRGGGPAGAGA